MSFKIVEQAPARLNRSELAVLGSQPQLFERLPNRGRRLPTRGRRRPDDKPQARKNVIQRRDIDWGYQDALGGIVTARHHFMYRDVVDVMEQGGERPTSS
jgi:malyl-CoA/(S)-citramalyl-CoA lyase